MLYSLVLTTAPPSPSLHYNVDVVYLVTFQVGPGDPHHTLTQVTRSCMHDKWLIGEGTVIQVFDTGIGHKSSCHLK